MLSLKEWNELPQEKRERIVKSIFPHWSNMFVAELSREYHHKLNYDDYGQDLKMILKHCTKKDDKIIVKVVFMV